MEVLPHIATRAIGAAATAGTGAIVCCGPLVAKILVTIIDGVFKYYTTHKKVQISPALMKELDFTKKWGEHLNEIAEKRNKEKGDKVNKDFHVLTQKTLGETVCMVEVAAKYIEAIE